MTVSLITAGILITQPIKNAFNFHLNDILIAGVLDLF